MLTQLFPSWKQKCQGGNVHTFSHQIFPKNRPRPPRLIILMKRIRLFSYYLLLPLSIWCFSWTPELGSALVPFDIKYTTLKSL